ncbi:hypothetical protein CMQ_102 [Grosmannia clavigera kw1407]|uniref:Urease accessory protein n=1 Tax=Grosmannia clavigera (strain kw1407 / UAMH 11150) TaxID=655863 RepID=F0XRG6_GROCL|nr:uncharacterized protein CMQ_102 [Grosmannia clavigera kw1407]EFW99784.1 hypothetical protein CMQ_102 [Grosmannia clavigera kw1407]
MPHKHTRRERDPSAFDLPPTEIARPLPVNKSSRGETAPPKKGSKAATAAAAAAAAVSTSRGTKRKRAAAAAAASKDDAPRAFRRLMAVAGGKRVRSGLDDGAIEAAKQAKKSKKEKKAAAAAAAAAEAAEEGDVSTGAAKASAAAAAAAATVAADAPEPLKIRPGERMSDFAARVDAALPISGLVPKGKAASDPLGLEKAFRTKKERKMHKLYAEWHEEERRLQERRAEEQDLAEEREMELDESVGVKWRLDLQQSVKKAQQAAGGGGGSGSNSKLDDDMWAELNRKRAATAAKAVRAGIHDVVTAPPQLTKINSEKVVLDDVPRSVVDPVARRELLAQRQDVLLSYRKASEVRRLQHQKQHQKPQKPQRREK